MNELSLLFQFEIGASGRTVALGILLEILKSKGNSSADKQTGGENLRPSKSRAIILFVGLAVETFDSKPKH